MLGSHKVHLLNHPHHGLHTIEGHASLSLEIHLAHTPGLNMQSVSYMNRQDTENDRKLAFVWFLNIKMKFSKIYFLNHNYFYPHQNICAKSHFLQHFYKALQESCSQWLEPVNEPYKIPFSHG